MKLLYWFQRENKPYSTPGRGGSRWGSRWHGNRQAQNSCEENEFRILSLGKNAIFFTAYKTLRLRNGYTEHCQNSSLLAKCRQANEWVFYFVIYLSNIFKVLFVVVPGDIFLARKHTRAVPSKTIMYSQHIFPHKRINILKGLFNTI